MSTPLGGPGMFMIVVDGYGSAAGSYTLSVSGL